MSEAIQFRAASREAVPLFISIAGPSGSGKTFSALKVARGLAGGTEEMRPADLAKIDATIACIDTEAGRMLHYAAAKGELPTANTFGFHHADLRPPFSPERYIEAIQAADKAGYRVIVVDSFTHIWEGDGGVKWLQKQALAKMIEEKRQNHQKFGRRGEFDPDFWEDKLSATAWDEPKNRYKAARDKILQCRAHVIVCLRAEEKLIIKEVEENGRKKTIYIHTKDLPEAQRWVPIIESRFHYEPIMSLVLSPTTPGKPHPIKLQEQHKPAVPLDVHLSERTGYLLNHWAHGGDLVNGLKQEEPPRQEPKQQAPAGGKRFEDTNLYKRGIEKADQGRPVWIPWVSSLDPRHQEKLEKHFEDVFRPRLDAADAKRQGNDLPELGQGELQNG